MKKYDDLLKALTVLYINSTYFKDLKTNIAGFANIGVTDDLVGDVVAEVNSSLVSFVLSFGGMLEQPLLFDIKPISLHDTAFFDTKNIPLCIILFLGTQDDISNISLSLTLKADGADLELVCQD